jgi:hypothetical protein
MMGMTSTKDLAIEVEVLCREEPENTAIQEKIGILIENMNVALSELKV